MLTADQAKKMTDIAQFNKVENSIKTAALVGEYEIKVSIYYVTDNHLDELKIRGFSVQKVLSHYVISWRWPT